MIAGLFCLALAACTGDGRDDAARSPGTPAAAGTTAAAQAAAGRFSPEDFARLRWLEGSWRGQLPDGGFFHERYRFVDDSTIAMHGFADSTFANATDSSRITLRGQTVANEGAARWVATALDSAGAAFAPDRGASNYFTWTRESADRWTATLRSGSEPSRTTVYAMERFKR